MDRTLTHQHERTNRYLLLPLLISGLVLLVPGCFLFGGDSVPDDPCQGISNRFVTQHSNGLGVMASECIESERGEWIDGRCYCHGEQVNAY